MTKIDQRVLEILSAGSIDGSVFRLNCGQLDRKTYEAVNKVLDALGGKWNRKLGGHVFPLDGAAEVIDQAILNGEVGAKNPLEFFETPPDLADQIVARAGLHNAAARVLEPSAGEGAIIAAMRRGGFSEWITAVELDKAKWERLMKMPRVNAYHCDFMDWEPSVRFKYVLMNPPFSRSQDIAHIRHAHDVLAPGGRLVAIASAGVTFRQEEKYVAFREAVLADGGNITGNPEATFKGSGTNVNTVIVVWPAL